MTVTASLGAVLVGSSGSILVAPVTSAKDSSGAMATLCGGPMTLAGASTVARTRGGKTLRSMIVAVSGGGAGLTTVTPSLSATLASLAETASCALAAPGSNANAAARPIQLRIIVVLARQFFERVAGFKRNEKFAPAAGRVPFALPVDHVAFDVEDEDAVEAEVVVAPDHGAVGREADDALARGDEEIIVTGHEFAEVAFEIDLDRRTVAPEKGGPAEAETEPALPKRRLRLMAIIKFVIAQVEAAARGIALREHEEIDGLLIAAEGDGRHGRPIVFQRLADAECPVAGHA